MLDKQPKRKLRYAVVGLGYIAQAAVLPAFRNARKNSELKALISGDPEKLKRLGEKYKVQHRYLYSELETCLKSGEIDAIYICTPNFLHRNIMETAARYGVHVICEKPLAVTTEECLSMINEAKKNDIQLMVGYRLHFEAANLEAIRRAHSKQIGDLRIFHSVCTYQIKDSKNIRLESPDRGGGPLYDIGIYCINAARYLFKAGPVEVFAMATKGKDTGFKKSEEMVSCVMKFPEGKLATFSVSFGAFPTAEYDLVGTKGRIKLERAYEYSKTKTLKTYEEGKIRSKKYPRRDQFAPELLYFSDCVQKKKTPEPSGEEGLADVKIIEAILLSIDLGSPITLDEMNKRTRPANQQKITRLPFARPRPYNVISPEGIKHS